MDLYVAAALLIGLLAGGGSMALLRGREIARWREALHAEQMARAAAEVRSEHSAGLQAGLEAARRQLAAADSDRARLDAEQAASCRAHADQTAALTSLRGEIEQRMKTLARDALDGSQAAFLGLAEQVFGKHRQLAAETLDARQKAIEAVLAPLAASLGDLEKARREAYGGLANELQSLARLQADASAQTRKLVNALQAAPKTRGRWGEQQLHNVLELSGMTAFVDFVAEKTIEHDDARLRPDVIIRLPGDRRIVVDAKTSMAAYLDAVEDSDDASREAHLQRHARQLRQHMRRLAAKAYWEALPVTPDFVVMFIPGENFFAAAIERDPQLFEDAVAARILIVTPTTLIALAKAVAFGWRQEKIADNAREIAVLGRDLYRRLSRMGGYVADVGAGLDRAVKSYNHLVGSLETSVMPQARKFAELEVPGTQDALPDLRRVEIEPREIRSDRDLMLQAAKIAG